MICLVAVIAMAVVSCNQGSIYKVTVVKNQGFSNLIGGNRVIVITQNGDSTEAIISEGLLFNKKLPFSAIMEKNEIARYGFIKDSTENNVFEVIIKEKAVNDLLLGGNKVIATTKSGMLVECFITEELLLKNKLPFSAKMTKNENGRYGFIQ